MVVGIDDWLGWKAVRMCESVDGQQLGEGSDG